MEKGIATGTASLAYLGDAVFELRVREMLLTQNANGTHIHTLNKQARKYVSAPAQGAMYHALFPTLTEEEQAVMKRGRNLHSTSRAKNADAIAYRHATGLETLFGYLYERGEHTRINELFQKCVDEISPQA
ncbi:MAG: Mini-ribonuclease 3 [Defluviitaleaceae bacterium]|nr:Mini-ribonuclease 3 [Defluviitaleaceae bacterium]MCL2275678.1 Mini-ribonuclease 3 [Defluviitaleaceae bacterium]